MRYGFGDQRDPEMVSETFSGVYLAESAGWSWGVNADGREELEVWGASARERIQDLLIALDPWSDVEAAWRERQSGRRQWAP